ncbi:hypothetical protein [Methanococcoides sp. AM1]|uniref:hypothetical protein n=1 Tax=Methanococcoides sp. AM1 TaxID=1201011 RepID=UPI001082B8BA|nr:hypothetical protein [Methanococcoides sp. AM1]
MEQKLLADKRTEYIDRAKDTIKNPSYSIFAILGLTFILALIGVLFDLFSMFIILLGPIITLACYAYYTGNKLSSAILGLLVIPLMFFYAGPIGAIVDFQFARLDRYFE